MAVRRWVLIVVLLAVAASTLAIVDSARGSASLEHVCGSGATPPRTYRHVVVIMEENRTWPRVGGAGFGAMPYLHSLASECTSYARWNETNATQDSLTQYVGLTSGVDNATTVNDCLPSACRSLDDNIFRQVRDSGGTARTYVEGAAGGCQSGHHPANVPALYYFGANDHSLCRREVRPFTEFDPSHLPTFAMIIPNHCDNGHDCSNRVVDAWLKVNLGAIMRSPSYHARDTAVFVLYDEDRPVPNLVVAPTAHEGVITSVVGTHRAALRTIEEMLGLPVLPAVRHATSLRTSAHI